ncbi:MAG TPA: immunoglobulin-like domain-containing protein, partial [Candidatus Paceibacterota bacterium]|nr:immunoglobulin-like domain-containing protein [Candidatus Paceibacterota bacterium]
LGTTSPYAQLALGGGNLVLGAATAGGTPGDLFLPKLGTAAGTFLAVDATGKVISTSTPSASLAGTTGQVAYFSGTNTAVGTSTLSITTGSNVGIGTSTPWAGYKLAVNGGTLIHATTNYNLLLDSNGLSAQDDSGATAAMTITGGTATLQATADANVKSLVSGAVRLSTNAGEKLTITSGGNVGIASTTPTSAFSVGVDSYFGGNVGIGSSSPTAALSFTAGATTAAKGINFGDGTANLYRSAAGTIKTDGNLYIAGGTITALTPTIINTNGSTIFSNNNGAESFISSSGSAQSDVITTGGRAVLTLGSVVTWAPNSATNSALYTGLTVSPTVNAGASNVGGTFYGVRINPTFTSTTGLTATYLFGVASGNNDKFVINSTGLVGAGTTTPAGAQIVASNATLPQLLLTDTSLTNNQWGFRNAGGNLYIATTSPSTNATSTATAFTIASDGGLVAYNATGGSKGIGTINAQTVYANNVALTSDVRYKKDIQALDDSQGLSFIQSLAPVSYHWADATMGTDLNLGFIAQDVQKIAPELVSVGSDKDHTLALNYIGLISPAVKAIQELAVQTSDLSLATTSLASRFASLSASVNASLADIQLPHALTATVVTADSMTIAQGVSAGALTTQSVTASGTVSAARYVVPLTASVFSFGSTTISMHAPDEALANDGNVDLYKLAGYAVAGTDALAARTDLLATKLDDLTTRIAALEALHAATTTASTTDGTSTAEGALGLTITTIQDALKGLGIIIHKGYLALDSLVTHQLFLVKGEDGTSSTGSQVIPAGATTLNVTNPLVHPSSKIFLTFTSSVDGSWYLSKKQEGSFTITLAKPQPVDTEFDYFLLQTDPNAQVAAVDQANQPPAGASEAPTAPASVSQDGGPVVGLNGEAAIQLAQGAAWTDPGAHAVAADGTDLTSSITVAGSVDTNTAGLYTLTYNV